MTSEPQQSTRDGPLRRTFRVLLIGIAELLLLPYALAPLYRVVNPVSTLMLWHWAKGARVERVWVPIDRIGPTLPRAVILAEDDRFCTHHGVDFGELNSAVKADL